MNLAATSSPELIDLTCQEWDGRRYVQLKGVPRSSTVGQVVAEAAEHLGLPFQNLYQAVLKNRELDPANTLDELEIVSDSRIELVAEVSAG